MSLLTVYGTIESSFNVNPQLIYIDTTDSLATVLTTGYLTGQSVTPYAFYYPNMPLANNQMAIVNTTDGMILLTVIVAGSVISLGYPKSQINLNTFSTAPSSQSLASTLAVGTAWKNTLGYNVMVTVYLNITAAVTASILLGVGPTTTPTQQTIISGLTLSVLGIIPINMYIPNNYYAKLSTTGTIAASISGQIAMPI